MQRLAQAGRDNSKQPYGFLTADPEEAWVTPVTTRGPVAAVTKNLRMRGEGGRKAGDVRA